MRRILFSLLLAVLVPMAAGAQEMYAIYDYEARSLTFYYDNERGNRGYVITPNEDPEFRSQGRSATKVIFDASFSNARPTTTKNWFNLFISLEVIEGLENLNTSEVTDMSSMFSDCRELTALDVSRFDTQSVTDMSGMFRDCRKLTALDVSHFNTGNVTDMGGMFSRCSGLTSLDVTGFNTENVTDMCYMFYGCSGLKSIDVSGFKTENVTNMYYMFAGCSGLTSLDVTGFKTDNVTSMSSMFSGCSGLTSLDLSGFNTGNVESMNGMFQHCSSLTTIYAGDRWSTAEVQYGGDMFNGCTSLVGGAGTRYDESHIDHTYAHIDGGSDNPGYFTAAGAEPWHGSEQPEGDLSGDGKLDADDLVTLVNVIMGGDKDKLADADLNGDGKVDVADVVMLVKMIVDGK